MQFTYSSMLDALIEAMNIVYYWHCCRKCGMIANISDTVAMHYFSKLELSQLSCCVSACMVTVKHCLLRSIDNNCCAPLICTYILTYIYNLKFRNCQKSSIFIPISLYEMNVIAHAIQNSMHYLKSGYHESKFKYCMSVEFDPLKYNIIDILKYIKCMYM
jgi:hypothetical protein